MVYLLCIQIVAFREVLQPRLRDQMLVTYVVTFYNKFDFIAELIKSIEAQLGDFEKQLVIADDCSMEEHYSKLEALVEDYDHFPIRLIRSDVNTGPAQCFNRSLDAVEGEVVVAIDADDLLAPNATSYYLEQMDLQRADFIYGRRRPQGHKKNNKTDIEVTDDPLAYVIKNNIVHMCFAAKTDLLRKVGGADPRLFIQDQSLPLRLASGARRFVRSEVVTVIERPDEAGLSKNVGQQHYDRFWMVMNFIDDHSDLSSSIQSDLMDIARSALWKMDRDKGSFKFSSPHFWRYIIGRLSGFGPSAESLKQASVSVFEGESIRRPHG